MNSTVASIHNRIGCSSISFRHLPLLEALDKMQALGFEAVDIGVVPGYCPHLDLRGWTEADSEKLIERVRQRKLRVSSFNVNLSGLARRSEAEGLEFLEQLIRLAARLGARTVTLPVGPAVPEEAWLPAAQSLVRQVRRLAEAAEPLGLRVSLEAPHTGGLASNYEQSSRLFELIQDRRVGCTFDTSHAQHNDPRPLEAGLVAVRAEVLHVHLRDTLGVDFGMTPGKGICDYGGFFAALEKSGYRGDLNLELEGGAAEAETEARFARGYLEAVLAGGPLPSEYAQWRSANRRALMRARYALHHPKSFFTSWPWYAAIRPLVRPFLGLARATFPLPYYRYEARWRKRYYTGKPLSVKLRRAAGPRSPSAGIKRVAVLGCGTVGAHMHAPALASWPGIEVVGVCDTQYAAAKALGKQLGCRAFGDVTELVNQTKPDLVANCTSEAIHSETSLYLLEHGMDVFCEKIMAESMASGEKMVRVAADRGRVLGVNYNWRFHSGIRKILQLKEAGTLGELCLLRFGCHAHVWHHVLDLAVFLGGKPLNLVAQSRLDPLFEDATSWRRFAGELLYLPGVYANALLETREKIGIAITSSNLWDPMGLLVNLEAVFRRGVVSLSGVNTRDVTGILSCNRPEVDLRLNVSEGQGACGYAVLFKRSVDAFLEAYLQGRRPPTTGEDGLLAMRLEQAASESARTGRKITLE
jgi:predicted dehydrogenase/sugar phosphate isomerase/epimerase